ncbi:MAG: hypothetical protein AB7K68_16385 [Bacteriovoracia bacterium]
MKQSLVTGIGAGAVTGLVLGPAVNHSGSNARLGGALIGAAFGGLAAYFIHDGIEARDARIRKETLFNLDKFNVSRPSSGGMESEYGLATPNIETQCFDTEVRGNRLVQAHCESRIIGSPEWVKGRKKKASE